MKHKCNKSDGTLDNVKQNKALRRNKITFDSSAAHSALRVLRLFRCASCNVRIELCGWLAAWHHAPVQRLPKPAMVGLEKA